jgi:hypothetical protein
MCGQVKILTRFDLRIGNGNFPSTCGLEYSIAFSYAFTGYRHESVAAITLIFFENTELDYWKKCPSIRVSTCGLTTTVVRHIVAVNGCLRVILDGGLVADV